MMVMMMMYSTHGVAYDTKYIRPDTTRLLFLQIHFSLTVAHYFPLPPLLSLSVYAVNLFVCVCVYLFHCCSFIFAISQSISIVEGNRIEKKHSNNSNPIECDECMDVCVCKAMFQYIKVCRQINCIERNSAAAAAAEMKEEEDSFALSYGCSFLQRLICYFAGNCDVCHNRT